MPLSQDIQHTIDNLYSIKIILLMQDQNDANVANALVKIDAAITALSDM